MNKEEKQAIKNIENFANGIDLSCVNAREMQILLDLYQAEKEKNNKALEYIETLEINSIGTTFKYTEIGNEIWKRLKGE